MLRLGGAVGVPEHLGVQVGVVVDEAGGDYQPGRVDRPRRAAPQAADRGDLAVPHPHIGEIRRQPRPVYHTTAANEQVVFHSLALPACNAILATP